MSFSTERKTPKDKKFEEAEVYHSSIPKEGLDEFITLFRLPELNKIITIATSERYALGQTHVIYQAPKKELLQAAGD